MSYVPYVSTTRNILHGARMQHPWLKIPTQPSDAVDVDASGRVHEMLAEVDHVDILGVAVNGPSAHCHLVSVVVVLY